MPRLLAFLAAGILQASDIDPREIVRRAVNVENDNWKIARNYTFVERVEVREVEDGKIKKRENRSYDITLQEGSTYRRLIERDDKPLPAAEEKREQDKLQRSIDERRKETEAQRSKRLAESEKKRERFRSLMREIPEAFDFQMLPEETISGRAAYVLACSPRAGFKPKDGRAKPLSKMRGKLWIAKNDFQWIGAQAEVIDTISFGWFLARLAKGSKIELHQTYVNNEVWLPRLVRINASARVGLVKKFNADQELTYKNYRKFQSDSQIVSTTEIENR